MAYDAELAAAISNTFRATVTTRLNTPQKIFFETLLQSWFGLKNLRNAQLWTREGMQTRNFINRNVAQFEMILRVFVASRFIQADNANRPTKTKCWRMPPDNSIAQESFGYFQNPYIYAYTHRIYFQDLFFCIEYYAESDMPDDQVDVDSPEFDDLIED